MYLYWVRDAARRYSGLILGYFLTGIFGFRFFVESIKNVQEAWGGQYGRLAMVSIWGNCLASPSSWQASRSSSTPTAIRLVLSPLTKRKANNIEALPES